MKYFLILLALLFTSWIIWVNSLQNTTFKSTTSISTAYSTFEIDPKFQCDGREYCSQMNSCDEAIYFINHCPNTKMDGDNDGVPCESQWCGN